MGRTGVESSKAASEMPNSVSFTCHSVEEVLCRHKSRAAVTSTSSQRQSRFRLLIRQEPRCGLAVGNEAAGLKNARTSPIDPPPICEVVPELKENVRLLSLPELSLHARLVSADDAEAGSAERDLKRGSVQPLVGDTDQCAFIAPKIQTEQERCLFVFSELGVRQAGSYRIRMDLVERVGHSFATLASVYTGPFEVHATRSTFPGLAPSSELIQAICQRGLKIRLLKEAKQSKKSVSKKRKMDDGGRGAWPAADHSGGDGARLPPSFAPSPLGHGHSQPPASLESPRSSLPFNRMDYSRETSHHVGPPALHLSPPELKYNAPEASIFHYNAQVRHPMGGSTASAGHEHGSHNSSSSPPSLPMTPALYISDFPSPAANLARRTSRPSIFQPRRLLPQMPPVPYDAGCESNPMFRTPNLPAERASRSFLLARRPWPDINSFNIPILPSSSSSSTSSFSPANHPKTEMEVMNRGSLADQQRDVHKSRSHVGSGRWGDHHEALYAVPHPPPSSRLNNASASFWDPTAKRIHAPARNDAKQTANPSPSVCYPFENGSPSSLSSKDGIMSVSSLVDRPPSVSSMSSLSPSTLSILDQQQKNARPILPPLSSMTSSNVPKTSTTSSGLPQWDRGVNRDK